MINSSGWAACADLSILAEFDTHLDAVRKESLLGAVHGLGSTNSAAC